jgi:hypothetical protein
MTHVSTQLYQLSQLLWKDAAAENGVAGATLPALTWTQPDPVWTSPWTIYLSVCLPICLSFFYLLSIYIYIYLYINLYLHINLSRDLVIFPIRLKNPRAHHPIVHQPSITTRKFKMWDYLVPLSFVWITWKARASWIKLSVVKLPFSERCFTIARCKVSSST